MKIYRTINFKTLLVMLAATVVFVIIMVFATNGDIELILSPEIYIPTGSMVLIIFYTILGDTHLLFMSPETHGYKYFRSLPDAFAKFKKYCLTIDLIFGGIGLILLMPVIISGFSKTSAMISFAVYGFIFAAQHFLHCMKSVNTSRYTALKAAVGGGIGAAIASFATSATAGNGLDKISPTVCIVVCSIAAILAVISAVALHSRLKLKWDCD